MVEEFDSARYIAERKEPVRRSMYGDRSIFLLCWMSEKGDLIHEAYSVKNKEKAYETMNRLSKEEVEAWVEELCLDESVDPP